jgi:DNA (cytosine-5)-methyltransferase 1
MRPLLVDLFCCQGGAAVGYHRAGFDIIGVDHKPQPNYPFTFERADALVWLAQHPSHVGDRPIAAIHASPPCQCFTLGRHIHNSGHKHQNLIPATRDLLRQFNGPWAIENVPLSPLINPTTMCGMMFGLRVFRHRKFECSFPLTVPPHPKHPPGDNTGSSHGYSTGANGYVTVAGHNFVRAAAEKAMGIDWHMSRYGLAQAIPPAYTEHVGKQMISLVRGTTNHA